MIEKGGCSFWLWIYKIKPSTYAIDFYITERLVIVPYKGMKQLQSLANSNNGEVPSLVSLLNCVVENLLGGAIILNGLCMSGESEHF